MPSSLRKPHRGNNRDKKTRLFVENHLLSDVYCKVYGRLKRVLKKDNGGKLSRMSSGGISLMTIFMVNHMFLILSRLEALNRRNDKKKRKINPNHFMFAVRNTELRNCGMCMVPIISAKSVLTKSRRSRGDQKK